MIDSHDYFSYGAADFSLARLSMVDSMRMSSEELFDNSRDYSTQTLHNSRGSRLREKTTVSAFRH